MLRSKLFSTLLFFFLTLVLNWVYSQDKPVTIPLNQAVTPAKPTPSPAAPVVPTATPAVSPVAPAVNANTPIIEAEPSAAKYEEYQSICRTNDHDLVADYSEELKEKRIKLLKDKVINTEKNSIKIELRLAKEYLDQDKDAELKSLATDLKKRKLSKLDNEFLNALVAFSENNLISAITILSQLLVDNEANVEALKLLAEVYIADDNYFEASAAYEDLNKLTKNSYLLEFCQAIVLNSLNADGEKFCLQAATQYPNNPFPIIFIGISQRERGDLRRAILSFKKAVALKSTEMGHTCLAEAYFLKENYDLAIEQFQKSIELSQYSQRAVLGLAWAYLKKKNYTDSLATFKRACKTNSKTVIEIRKAFKELNLEKNPEDKNFIKLIEACGG